MAHVGENDRTIHHDASDIITAIKSLREDIAAGLLVPPPQPNLHLHQQNLNRLDKLEADQKEQLTLLNQIQQQTQDLPSLRKQVEEHDTDIKDLVSDRNQVMGAKKVLGFFMMMGAGAVGAWVKSLFGPHTR